MLITDLLVHIYVPSGYPSPGEPWVDLWSFLCLQILQLSFFYRRGSHHVSAGIFFSLHADIHYFYRYPDDIIF
jgi:hypothetical protein